ncbi:Sensor histidine kinase ComP [compost metagenome]
MITVGNVDQELAEKLIEEGLPENSFYTCFEITKQEDFTAYLIVTEKRTGTILGLEEIHWLQLILTYLAVSLENVQLIRMLDNKIQTLSSLVPREEDAENIRWFRKLMFSLQEKERVRIAMDIHDSTMQDLFFLKRRLQNIQGQHTLTKEGQEALDSAAEFIDMINAGLRQSCFELHPYMLRDIGLVEALNKLFHVERAVAEFKIDFTVTGIQQIEEQTLEIKQHIFRMIQELLNNAKKYSKASEIRFFLHYRKGSILLEYCDDGMGFQETRPVVREIGSSGRGLEQLKSRVQSLEGSYELDTSPGKGVRFSAQIPAHEERNRA